MTREIEGEELDEYERDRFTADHDDKAGREFSIDDETVVLLTDGAALVTYRFSGTRRDTTYAARLSSAYVRSDGEEWKLAFHQHSPVEGR